MRPLSNPGLSCKPTGIIMASWPFFYENDTPFYGVLEKKNQWREYMLVEYTCNLVGAMKWNGNSILRLFAYDCIIRIMIVTMQGL